MVQSLTEFRKHIKPQVQIAAREKAVNIVAQMSLAQTRKAQGLSQTMLAKQMAIAQPNVSQIENRPDALISTLKQYIEGLGGELHIQATFPDGQVVEITQFK